MAPRPPENFTHRGARLRFKEGENHDEIKELINGSGTVLASAKVTTSDPREGSPILFYSHAITPISLAANTTYFIAEDLGGGTTVYDRVASLTTNPAITYDGGVLSGPTGQGQNPTTDFFQGAVNPGYFGPNFDIAAVPAPPIGAATPANLALLAGALGLFHLTRRSRRRA